MERRPSLVRHMLTSSGFTVVELVIVVTVSAILAGILFGPLNDLYQTNAKSITKVIQTTDTRGALRSIQSGISLSSGFLAQNVVADPAGTTWNATNGGVNNVLVTSNNATDIDPGADTTNSRRLVLDTGCNTPLKNNIVYFVSNGTLYRRLLKNTSPTCGGMAIGQKQTCAANYSSQSYKDSCQGIDATILTGVTSFTVDYYAAPADLTTTSDPTAATTVVLKVTTQKGIGNNATSYSSSLRISRIN